MRKRLTKKSQDLRKSYSFFKRLMPITRRISSVVQIHLSSNRRKRILLLMHSNDLKKRPKTRQMNLRTRSLNLNDRDSTTMPIL
jgi:hypothetical protein